MKVNRRRLARGIALVGAILALGFLVGFSSIYLGGLLSQAFTSQSGAVLWL